MLNYMSFVEAGFTSEQARKAMELIVAQRERNEVPATVAGNFAAGCAVIAVAAAILWWSAPRVVSQSVLEWIMITGIVGAAGALIAAISLAIWSDDL